MRAAQWAEECVWRELEDRLSYSPTEILQISSFWRSLEPHGPADYAAVQRAFGKAIRWGFMRRRQRGEYVFTEIVKLQPKLLKERSVLR